MCGLVIVGCGVRLRRVRGGKSVSELNVQLLGLLLLLLLLLLLSFGVCIIIVMRIIYIYIYSITNKLFSFLPRDGLKMSSISPHSRHLKAIECPGIWFLKNGVPVVIDSL
jgi:hypothetical protein